MANKEHLEILKKGVEAWNIWRKQNLMVLPDLNGADLFGENLEGADLSGASLVGADLNGADLRGADLSGANLAKAALTSATFYSAGLQGAILSRARLDEADLSWADFAQAELWEANLRRAELYKTNFSRAFLKGADFSDSGMLATSLGYVDLSEVKGLETVRHLGPSTIGIDTIHMSKGNIPEVFLRGAGVPENFIEYMGSLIANPIEYHSCFISYSSKDEEFARRLHVDLQTKGVRCWFAPHDVQGGRKLHEQIDQAIRVHERVLLILSAHSMGSEWVKTEIAKARKREVEQKKKVLFPLRLVSFEAIRDWECFDADAAKDSAREIREYFIPDFSNWKNHDEYQKAFERLMKDLKAGEKGEEKMAT